MTTLLLTLIALLPTYPARAESLELNHVHREENGEWQETLSQLIWWGYYADGCYVRRWNQVSDGELAVSGNLVLFRGELYRASAVWESWTSWDVEVEDRERMPVGRRVK